MSKFLENLIRSEIKSCAGKIKFPREDSAQRSAAEMMVKKGNGEVFEHYYCKWCESFHIGHRTSFDWIPVNHRAYTVMIIQYLCLGGCFDKDVKFLTNTVISDRIMCHFPIIKTAPEVYAHCPICRSPTIQELERRFISLADIPLDSTETIDSLWNRNA